MRRELTDRTVSPIERENLIYIRRHPAVRDVPRSGQPALAGWTRGHVAHQGFPRAAHTARRAPGRESAGPLCALRATLLLVQQALWQPRDLAGLTTDQWFRRVGMPAKAREALWDWLALGIAAEPVDRESAKVFADVLATGIRIGVRDRAAVTIGYPTVDLDTLFIHGAQRVFARHGVDVRYRAVARKIIVSDGRATGVRLADGSVLAADAVICAVPNTNIGGLLDDLPEHPEIYAAADKLGVTPIVSTNLYLDRPLRTKSAMEALIGGTGVIDEVFDRQRMHGRTPDGT
ncbi:FAD-dependent oxidoreductase [Nocardia neocaledoniensis]|uniref:FAD-dependent oxidoreductase n=1 Tax=Nocardia neocaledoniensis TaxID=236511 RepID=UPI0033EB7DD9